MGIKILLLVASLLVSKIILLYFYNYGYTPCIYLVI